MLRYLFGENVTVVTPKEDDKDWDDSIHAECDDPSNAAPTTGGRVVSYREWRANNPYPNKPSSWKPIDVIPALVIGLLCVIALLGVFVAVAGWLMS